MLIIEKLEPKQLWFFVTFYKTTTLIQLNIITTEKL